MRLIRAVLGDTRTATGRGASAAARDAGVPWGGDGFAELTLVFRRDDAELAGEVRRMRRRDWPARVLHPDDPASPAAAAAAIRAVVGARGGAPIRLRVIGVLGERAAAGLVRGLLSDRQSSPVTLRASIGDRLRAALV